ncbi:MAG: hypothetical protein NWF05_10905 [Candidatus Bathyarchaeota archaeon]|nr:hypothetical protein [Candidatus Bathyarchaeota archaeon]
MPQLVKGGKFVYAWSAVGSKGRIVVPHEALVEYDLLKCKNVILMPGSKRSGGFGLTSKDLLKNSPLHVILDENAKLSEFQTPEGEAIEIKGKTYCWVKLSKNGSITVPAETLKKYGITPGYSNILSVRGSRLAIGFSVKGPIIEEAKQHPNLEILK